ncbi:MAG: mechanosensitive ion channel domain-containing protein [Collinsella sp.]
MVTGLGVVGIAVSLGFQDTLSNLIGGLTVSVSRTVEPGDNIRMGPSGVTGVVQDVTWRATPPSKTVRAPSPTSPTRS